MHKSILVTGASSGIGEATAIDLAHHGFKVFAAARRLEKLKSLAGLAHGRIIPIAMDVTDEASIASAMEEISKETDTLFGLVNNAGVSVMGPGESVPISDWRRQFETNVFGVVNVSKAVLPQMRAAGVGRIVNVGSVAGRIVAPFMTVYGASKHALEGLSDGMRRELKPHGVKVIIIRPGFTNTPFAEQEQEELEKYVDDDPYAEQVKLFKNWHSQGHVNGPPPTMVADVIHKALIAERPHTRYTVPAKMLPNLMLRNLAPSALTDRIFERVTGLNKYKKGDTSL